MTIEITNKMLYYIYITTNKMLVLNKLASSRKEKAMEEMNTYELETFLKMILEILNGCKDIQEAKEKIKALLER